MHINGSNTCRGFLLLEVLICITVVSIVLPGIMMLVYQGNSLRAVGAIQSTISKQNDALQYWIAHAGGVTPSEEMAAHSIHPLLYSYVASGTDSGATYNTHAYEQMSLGQQHYYGQCLFDTLVSVRDFELKNRILLPQSTGTINALLFAFPYLYIGVDAVLSRESDLYVYKVSDDHSVLAFELIHATNTGPGITSLDIDSNYVYAGEGSSRIPFRIIERQPTYKSVSIFTDSGTTTFGYASHVFVDRDVVYLGTEKNNREELYVFRRLDHYTNATMTPLYQFELGSKVGALYRPSNFARLFFTTSIHPQIHWINASNPSSIYSDNLTLPGYAVQDIQHLSEKGQNLVLGRTVGGFNVAGNHEVLFGDISGPTVSIIDSLDTGANVISYERYGGVSVTLLGSPKNKIEIQAPHDRRTFSLPVVPRAMTCFGGNIFIGGESEQDQSVHLYVYGPK